MPHLCGGVIKGRARMLSVTRTMWRPIIIISMCRSCSDPGRSRTVHQILFEVGSGCDDQALAKTLSTPL